jgi:hypothetical protein
VFLDQRGDLLEHSLTAAILETAGRARFHDADALIDPLSGLCADFFGPAEARAKLPRVQKDNDRSHVSHQHSEPLERKRLSCAEILEHGRSPFRARHRLEHAGELCELLLLRYSQRLGCRRFWGAARGLLERRSLCGSLVRPLLRRRLRLSEKNGAADNLRRGRFGHEHGNAREHGDCDDCHYQTI